MRILVFGSTGKTGLQIVRQALDRGHAVAAFLRDPTKLDISHANLSTISGDILQPDSIESAFSDKYDAVISALGIFHREPRTDLSDGTQNIIGAMQKNEIRRLLVVSSVGAGDSKGQGNFLARNLQRLLLSHVLADKDTQEKHIAASRLDWTIVRPPQLTDDATIRTDLVAWEGPTPAKPALSWKVSRASVAAFLLDELEQSRYIGKAVNISNPK